LRSDGKVKNLIQYPSVNAVPEGYTVRPMTFGITATLQLQPLGVVCLIQLKFDKSALRDS
jgi:hypothetical protein